MTDQGDDDLDVPPPGVVQPDWRGMIRRIGRLVYAGRQVLGLSQDALAKLAGTSQGGVSRVEAAKQGMAIPLVTYARLGRAMAWRLRSYEPYLSPELRAIVAAVEAFGVLHAGPGDVFIDERLTRVLACMNNANAEKRDSFLAAVALLADAWFPDGPPT